MQISEIDKNFEIQTQINKDDIEFFDIDSPPFEICGVFKENGIYRRMPEKVATNISEGVRELHVHTAGGRVRFATDSNYVAIYAKIDNPGRMPHFAFSGSAGLDLYADNEYAKTFVPPLNMDGKYEGIINFSSNTFREITINFPLYSGLGKLYVGLQKDSVVRSAKGYRNSKPVVFYGSSITQGGCASRPGMSYQSILSRRFNMDYVNLGFSGSAKAEEQMAEYIKNMDMSAFVYDYDYNAPTVEHLQNTHEEFFKRFRSYQPKTPVVMVSKANVLRCNDCYITHRAFYSFSVSE